MTCVIARVVAQLVTHEGRPFDEVYAEFLASDTYRVLQDPRAVLWAENAEFIVDEYYREQQRTQAPQEPNRLPQAPQQ